MTVSSVRVNPLLLCACVYSDVSKRASFGECFKHAFEPFASMCVCMYSDISKCRDKNASDWEFSYECCGNSGCDVGEGDCDKDDDCQVRLSGHRVFRVVHFTTFLCHMH